MAMNTINASHTKVAQRALVIHLGLTSSETGSVGFMPIWIGGKLYSPPVCSCLTLESFLPTWWAHAEIMLDLFTKTTLLYLKHAQAENRRSETTATYTRVASGKGIFASHPGTQFPGDAKDQAEFEMENTVHSKRKQWRATIAKAHSPHNHKWCKVREWMGCNDGTDGAARFSHWTVLSTALNNLCRHWNSAAMTTSALEDKRQFDRI